MLAPDGGEVKGGFAAPFLSNVAETIFGEPAQASDLPQRIEGSAGVGRGVLDAPFAGEGELRPVAAGGRRRRAQFPQPRHCWQERMPGREWQMRQGVYRRSTGKTLFDRFSGFRFALINHFSTQKNAHFNIPREKKEMGLQFAKNGVCYISVSLS